jgi:hypothetical protein
MAANEDKTGFQNLNLVFHGTFFFWVKPDEIEVLIPKVKMHVYYAGNWRRGELKPLQEGRMYTLANIPTQASGNPPAGFDTYDNIWFRADPDDTDPTLRRIRLPRPEKVATLQHLILQKDNFVGPEDHVSVPTKTLGLIHVLTYTLDPQNPPRLEGLDWEPKPSEAAKDTVNLHIFADPPARVSMASMTLKHPTEAFSALVKLIPPDKYPNIAQFQFQYLANEIPLAEPDPTIPGGLRRIELVSLGVSNLLDEGQMQGHGVVMKPRKKMAMGGSKTAGEHQMVMGHDDVGCNYPYNCVSGGGGNGH